MEITPLEDKDMKFINIYKDKSYYHIYLDGYLYNDNKLESHNIRKIKIILDHEINSLSRLFQGCKYIKRVDFNIFRRKNIIDMSHMFYGYEFLE